MANSAASFVIGVLFWISVLTIILTMFARRTRHRLRSEYPVKMSTLREGLDELQRKYPR